jgi:hypothetical protein
VCIVEREGERRHQNITAEDLSALSFQLSSKNFGPVC